MFYISNDIIIFIFHLLFFLSLAWLSSRGEDQGFEYFDNEKLNRLLEIFYAEAKSKEGKTYSKSTLISIRAGINRHIRNPPFKRNVFIMNSPEFTTSNRMLFAVIKNLKENGLDFTTHFPPISKADLEILQDSSSFNLTNPKQLQQKVFFDIMINFARRGQENLRSLKKNSFKFDHDDLGLEYCEVRYNEKTKNHQTIEDKQSKPRMYSNDSATCPIASLKLYLSKLHNNCDTFFTKNIESKLFVAERQKNWYTSKPLGNNTLAKMMKSISVRLNLSRNYTNHSIRATCITLLSSFGFEARQIMRVSGHKSESSLRSYDHDNSVEQKRKISQVLSKKPSASATTPLPFSSSSTTTNPNMSHNFSSLPLPVVMTCSASTSSSTTETSTNTSSYSASTSSNSNNRAETEENCQINYVNNNGSSHPLQHFVISNNTNCHFYFNSK